jgi:signal transduction histidine kinase/CheY-like chemotaxis protein
VAQTLLPIFFVKTEPVNNKYGNEVGNSPAATRVSDEQTAVRNPGTGFRNEDSTCPPSPDYFDFLRKKKSRVTSDESLGYVVIDERARILRANDSAVQMLGIGKERLSRHDFFSLIHQKDVEKYGFFHTNLPDMANRSYDIRMKAKEHAHWIRISVIFDEELFLCQKTISLILQRLDSDELESEDCQKLPHVLSLKQEADLFSVGIVHDLSNVLQPIIGHLEMLAADSISDRKLYQYLQRILTWAYRAGSLVRQFLSHRQDQENSGCGRAAQVHIQTVVREVLDLIRPTLPESVTIVEKMDPGCGPVRAGSTHLFQVVMNLVTNACYAMGLDGGTLEVTIEEIENKDGIIPGDLNLVQGRYACLSISDTGTGMDNDIARKIFDPYFTTKEKGTGTGIGLCVTHQIVNRYGGAMSVMTNPGKGSVFKVYLPYETKSEQQPRPETDSGRGGFVLLIAQDQVIADVQKEALIHNGCFVTVCKSGMEGLSTLKDALGMFNLIVCDASMPDVSGPELVGRIRDMNTDIPVIVYAPLNGSLTLELCLESGADEILDQPLNKVECFKLVRPFLQKLPVR